MNCATWSTFILFPGFGFAANPMRPSFINTVVGGAVLSRSPHLRPSATATLKGRANSLSLGILLGPQTISHRLSTMGLGFVQPVFADTGRNSPILSLRELRCQNPTDSDKRFLRFSRIPGKPKRNRTSKSSADFLPQARDFIIFIS